MAFPTLIPMMRAVETTPGTPRPPYAWTEEMILRIERSGIAGREARQVRESKQRTIDQGEYTEIDKERAVGDGLKPKVNSDWQATRKAHPAFRSVMQPYIGEVITLEAGGDDGRIFHLKLDTSEKTLALWSHRMHPYDETEPIVSHLSDEENAFWKQMLRSIAKQQGFNE